MTATKTLSLNCPRDSYLVKKSSPSVPSSKHGTPALSLMTDFQETFPITIGAQTRIDEALEHMIESGVRLLFVVDTNDNLLGSITSHDIQGEKPMLYMHSQDCRIGICSRTDIEVRDIMTPASKWKTVRHASLADANLNDIAHTFQELGQHHIIVVEPLPGRESATVRGLLSLSDLERTIGTKLMINETAESFSEIQRALST